MRLSRILILSLSLSLPLAACTPPTAPGGSVSLDRVLPELTRNVILPTYAELDAKAAGLRAAALKLQAETTQANLEAARQAWKSARLPWELSESHLLGPVKTQELDPELDSWPVNRIDLDGVLASGVTLDQTFIDQQQPTMKGFHVIEYVLFAKTPANLTARDLGYLVALTGSFRTATKTLHAAWDPAQGDFARQYAQPAAGGAFASPQAALAETLGAMAEICEEVANGKIEEPLSKQDKTLEESQFSGNSLDDFTHNLIGVQNLYLGRYEGRQGLGLTDLVVAKDPDLDARMRRLLDQAIADLKAVPGPFAEAIDKHPAALRQAQQSINAVRDALQKDVSLSLLGTVSADLT